MITPPKQLRADAQRNREAILAAASKLFARSGTAVPLEDIAAHAGVGIATLYRNFPTRDALVEAAYRSEVAQITAAATELLAAHPPDVALELWLDRYVDYVAAKRGMSDALRADVDAEDVFRATGSVFMLPQEDGWREQAARLLRLILDGLRYRASQGD